MQKTPKEYLEKLRKIAKEENYKAEESFINLPVDEENVAEIIQTAKECNVTKIKQLVVIGIGGSSLGTQAIYGGLKNHKKEDALAEITFLDQINLRNIEKAFQKLIGVNPKEAAIVIISKSGKTLETLKNYELLLEKGKEIADINTILVTGKGAELPVIIRENVNKVLYIENSIGGRFSVFSAVGLFPLKLAGIDILQLLKGAMWARKASLEDAGNQTLKAAQNTFENFQNGKEIYNIFIFSPELKALGLWYRQLIGESLGKKGRGLFPVISEGSGDLHSLQQYFIGGKRNAQHEFLFSEEENIYQKTILEAVQKTYEETDIPFKTYCFPKLNEASLGEFMQQKMIETILLAQFLDINPFGQPDVESYKQNVKKLLSGKDFK